MAKLSLCIPTLNEEASIRIPLDSAYDLVDEVVIVDGGSEDKTLEIARSYGNKVRVFEVDNPSNFLTNKERAIQYATGDWILQLDADEALSPELKKEIRSLLQGDIDSQSSSEKIPIDGYWIPRKNWFLGRYLMKGGVYPDAVLRLYKKQGAHFKLEHVHENVVIPGKTQWTKHAIEHRADPTFERYLSRWNRYTSFDAQQLMDQKTQLCGLCYFIFKPLSTFLSIYIRHKGFQDGFPGFVWALFSSIRYWAIFIKARTP